MPSARSSRRDVSAQILEHATRLFAAHGFVGASLRDIARAVGIRKPSLLYHFASKEELRRRVLEQMLGHWNETVPRILRAASSGPAQFDAIADETIRFFSEEPDRARLILRELLDRPSELAPLVELHVQPWARIVGDDIRKGQRQGLVDPDVDPEAYVVTVIGLVLGTVALHESLGELLRVQRDRDGERPKRSRRVIAETLRLAKAGLFARVPAWTPKSTEHSPAIPTQTSDEN